MTEQTFTADTSLINRRLADDSHIGTSFDPEKRAMQSAHDIINIKTNH